MPMALPFVETKKGGVFLRLYVQPKASKTEVVGLHQGRLKVRVQAPPVDGQANVAIVKLFARHLSWPKSQIEVATGQTGRNKTIEIQGAELSDVKEALESLLK